MRRLFAALGATGFVACAAFSAGTTNDAPPARGDDAGGDNATDAGRDVANDTTAAVARFCADQALCTDFDGTARGAWGEDGNDVDDPFSGGASLTKQPVGEPGLALVATLPIGDGEADITKRLLSPDLVDFELEGDVWIDPPLQAVFSNDFGVTVFKISYGGQPGNPTVEIRILPIPNDPGHAQSAAFFRTTGNSEIKQTNGPIVAYGQWLPMKIEARLVGAGDAMSAATIDGQVVTSVSLARADPATISNPVAIRSTIGIQRQDVGKTLAPMLVRYDNIVGSKL